MRKVKLVATDLDGTFLNNDRLISEKNRMALDVLGENQIIRVAATGRNLKKVREVISPEIPFDYIVFSSGAGVYDCKNDNYLLKENIPVDISQDLIKYLKNKDFNFNSFWAVPENYYLWYHRGGEYCEEYERFFLFHNSYAVELPKTEIYDKSICQFLIVIPNDPEYFNLLKKEILKKFPEVGIIRSTSPLGTSYIWMEVFNKNVSKGNAVSFLCKNLGIKQSQTVGLGNDYNDLELLEFTNESFIVENAPEELKSLFENIPSNEKSAFSHVVNQIINYDL